MPHRAHPGRLAILCLGLCASVTALAAKAPPIDDRVITVTNLTALETRRIQLIEYIWGQPTLPTPRLPEVERAVASPFSHLHNVRRVDCLTVSMEGGLQNKAYHFIPEKGLARLVIVHHGHHWDPRDDYREDYYSDRGYWVEQTPEGRWPERAYGMQRTVDSLLGAGYSVLYMMMPPMPHDEKVHEEVPKGHGLKFFLDPLPVNLQ